MVDTPRVLAGRYEIGELIGRGGMAEVHVGYDSRLSRTVAIKLLRRDLAADPTFHARFRREAQSAAALNHPSIVAVYDTGEEKTTDALGRVSSLPWIVMEYVEGHTVRELLKDGTAVPIDEALEIMVGILGALEYAHNEGIVHRDIKPGNVMLTPTGQVKVMDFGIARALADQSATMTATNSVVGTAQYLSPEQARGEVVDARSDLYSAACVLFELLTGQPPFHGDSAVSVAYQHVREVPPTPSSIAGDIPDSLDRVALKGLAKDRSERYQDANQFRGDLLAVLHGGAVSAPATTTWLAAAAAAGAGAGAMSAGSPTAVMGPPTNTINAVSRTSTGTMPAARPLSDDSERGSRWWIWLLALLAVAAVAGIALVFANRDGASTQVEVPSVEGMTQAEAADAVEAEGLVFNLGGQEPSETVEADLATRSDPEAGQLVDGGSTVTVYFSSGRAEAEVPSVENMPQDQAIETLTAAGLEVSRTTTEDAPGKARDVAIRTSPAAGTPVREGDSVELFVASGRVVLESLVGRTEADALAYLESLQLSSRVERVNSNDWDTGLVAAQSDSGTVDVKATITLTISLGPVAEPTTAPEPTQPVTPPTSAPPTAPPGQGEKP